MTVNVEGTAKTRPHIERVNRGKGHSYRLDGKPVPGVTTIISRALSKPALPGWAARCVAEFVADASPEALDALRSLGRDAMVKALREVPWTQRDAAAVRGTEIHALAEKLMKGERVDVPEELAGHVESTVQFLDSYRIAPVLTEATVASRQWKYAGTLDVVGDLPDGRRAILDYKSGRSGVFPEVALQLSAYRYSDVFIDATGAECQTSLLDIDCGLAVWVRADGFDVIPVECGPEQFKAFLHLVHVARAVDAMPTWIGEAEDWAAVS